MVQRFGIFGDYQGLNEKFPDILLSKTVLAESKNVICDGLAIETMKNATVFMETALAGEPILQYHLHRYGSEDTQVLFCGTSLGIYRYNGTTNEWDSFLRTNYILLAVLGGQNTFTVAGGDYTSVFATGVNVTIYGIATVGGAHVNQQTVEVLSSSYYDNGNYTDVTLTSNVTEIASSSYWEGYIGELSSGWSFASVGGVCVATNNVEPPYKWQSGDSSFVDLNAVITSGTPDVTLTRVKQFIEFDNYLIALNFDTSDSNSYTSGLAWSSIADPLTWEIGGVGSDAGTANIGGAGVIVGAGIKGNLLYIFKSGCIYKLWNNGGTLVWANTIHDSDVGAISLGSIIRDGDDNLFFIGTDKKIREVDYGIISNPVEKTVKAIETNYADNIRSTYIPDINQVWFAVTTDSSNNSGNFPDTLATNNTVICMSQGKWGIYEASFTAFGEWNNVFDYTWDMFDEIAEFQELTWDDMSQSWDDAMSGDYEYVGIGATYSGDEANAVMIYNNYSSMTNSFVIKLDPSDGGDVYTKKRILSIEPYFDTTVNDSISMYYRYDNVSEWQYLGEVSIDNASGMTVPFVAADIVGRNIQLKLESSNYMKFVGAVVSYVPFGTR